MKWVLIAGAVLAGLALLVVGIGYLLPVAHTATVEGRVAAPPDQVWHAMTAVEGFAAWRPGMKAVERLPDRGGLPAWRETSDFGTMTLEVTEWDPPRRMVTRIADQGLGFGGRWTYRLEPDGEGTRVTLTEDGEVYNPLFRFMSRFVFGYDGTMRAYLEGLQGRFAG